MDYFRPSVTPFAHPHDARVSYEHIYYDSKCKILHVDIIALNYRPGAYNSIPARTERLGRVLRLLAFACEIH